MAFSKPKSQLPKPFQRPGVSLARHGKAWQDVKPNRLSVNDMVLGRGAITEIHPLPNAVFRIHYLSGEQEFFESGAIIRAFTAQEG